jgi:hypothetical protein
MPLQNTDAVCTPAIPRTCNFSLQAKNARPPARPTSAANAAPTATAPTTPLAQSEICVCMRGGVRVRACTPPHAGAALPSPHSAAVACPACSTPNRCDNGYCSQKGCTTFSCWDSSTKNVCKVDCTGCAVSKRGAGNAAVAGARASRQGQGMCCGAARARPARSRVLGASLLPGHAPGACCRPALPASSCAALRACAVTAEPARSLAARIRRAARSRRALATSTTPALPTRPASALPPARQPSTHCFSPNSTRHTAGEVQPHACGRGKGGAWPLSRTLLLPLAVLLHSTALRCCCCRCCRRHRRAFPQAVCCLDVLPTNTKQQGRRPPSLQCLCVGYRSYVYPTCP